MIKPPPPYDRQTVLQRYRRMAELEFDPTRAPACPLTSHADGHPDPMESSDPALCDDGLCRGCCLALVTEVGRAAAAPTHTAVELKDTGQLVERRSGAATPGSATGRGPSDSR